VPAAHRPHQQQIGDVDACDKDDQPGRAEKSGQGIPDALHQIVAQRRNPGAHSEIGVRILLLQR
jgi:hypothetical protein